LKAFGLGSLLYFVTTVGQNLILPPWERTERQQSTLEGHLIVFGFYLSKGLIVMCLPTEKSRIVGAIVAAILFVGGVLLLTFSGPDFD
jgi:hypothetical protein